MGLLQASSKQSRCIAQHRLFIQMKVTARSTLRPLVDTLPCMGAVTVALVDTPHLDFSLHLFSRFDLMLLPGIRELAIATIQGVCLVSR